MPRFGTASEVIRAKSSPTDLVSEADVAAEPRFARVLGERAPRRRDPRRGGGEPAGTGALRWVIDPLDGTTNFLFGVPQFAVSVACEDADGALAGVVLDPVRDECFTATRSGAAELNGSRDRQLRRRGPGDRAGRRPALATTPRVRARQAEVLTPACCPACVTSAGPGAAALDLAWCACGRYDAYYERGVKPWDYAAGGLIAARAGLELRVLSAGERSPAGLLVAPPALVGRAAGARRRRLTGGAPRSAGAWRRRSRPSRRGAPAYTSARPRRWWNGRHGGLKSHCPSGRVGSNPTRRIDER